MTRSSSNRALLGLHVDLDNAGAGRRFGAMARYCGRPQNPGGERDFVLVDYEGGRVESASAAASGCPGSVSSSSRGSLRETTFVIPSPPMLTP